VIKMTTTHKLIQQSRVAEISKEKKLVDVSEPAKFRLFRDSFTSFENFYEDGELVQKK